MDNGSKWWIHNLKIPKYKLIRKESAMVVLSGEYRHTIDSKNRVFIPAKLREQLGEHFMIMQNVEGCLDIVTDEAVNSLVEKLASLPKTQTAKIKRFLFSGAADCTPDSQGRVIIPAQLVNFANIEKNVVIIGAADHAEIWSEELWLKNTSVYSNEFLSTEMENLNL